MNDLQAAQPDDLTILLARMRDYFALRTPWHRRLWTIGTVLGLREVQEYAEACLDGAHPTTEGLCYVAATARREASRDPGVAHLRSELDPLLLQLSEVKSAQKIPPHSVDELEALTRRAAQDYCARWRDNADGTSAEFAARALASHALDTHLSADHLFRWLEATGPSLRSTAELAEEMDSMQDRMHTRSYEVFIPCAAPFDKPDRSDGSLRWISGEVAARWLKSQVPEHKPTRQSGGFLSSTMQRDPWSAVAAALELVARADARVRVAQPSNESIKLDGWACVAGNSRKFAARRAPRQVEIGSLARQNAIYEMQGGVTTAVDDALELASHMESPSGSAAITGGWAAIEGLLIRAGEHPHHLAADRLAALITCSLPRAEMTPLAYHHAENANDALAKRIGAAVYNRDKVRLIEEHLRSGGRLTLTDPSDVAAQDRLLAVASNPQRELDNIRRYVTESLRRLYNQRNTVAHSGSLGSLALSATLRTALSLVGAGLDRIVHAQLLAVGNLEPLQLVARAETELRLIGGPGGRELASLLD